MYMLNPHYKYKNMFVNSFHHLKSARLPEIARFYSNISIQYDENKLFAPPVLVKLSKLGEDIFSAHLQIPIYRRLQLIEN